MRESAGKREDGKERRESGAERTKGRKGKVEEKRRVKRRGVPTSNFTI